MALRDFALLMVICLVWAANNIVSKLVVTNLGAPPLFYTAARFFVVGLVLFPFLLPMPSPRWRLIAVGLLMGGCNFALMFSGLKYATPSAAAVVLQLGVPATALLSFLILGERVDARRALGMALTVSGALIVMWDPHGLKLSYGLILIALSTVLGSLGMVLMKQMHHVRPIRLQAWVAFVSLWPLLVLSAWLEPGQVRIALAAGWGFVAAVLFTALIVSIVMHTLFYGLVHRYDANLIATMTIMVPIGTIALGVTITHDPFGLRMAVGSAVALAGVLVVTLKAEQLRVALAAMRRG